MSAFWYEQAVFYQIYPLGLCGAPAENNGETVSRITALEAWVPHIKALGANAVYFSPVFQSDRHGYDTRDYYTLDCRLGSNQDFAGLCELLHQNGVRVVLDGVFNHVGRGFWAFRDVQEKREASPYRDWFNIRFDGDSPDHDGFWYQGWEGHYELVKLNLKNPAVVEHIHGAIRQWVEQFGIDGLRLDVAYCLEPAFLEELRSFCCTLKPDFLLLGELLHGDYNRWVNDRMLHSCTNYECYKGLYSSFNEQNMFEIAHSLGRQFGAEQWCLYRGKRLLSFAENHDVSRIATLLRERKHLPLLYGVLFAMPGIPCVYYGGEWAAQGDKKQGDAVLRPAFAAPGQDELTVWLARLAAMRLQSPALTGGDYANLHIQNRQLVFQRQGGGERVVAAVNIADQPYTVPGLQGAGRSLLTGEAVRLEGLTLPPFSFDCYRLD